MKINIKQELQKLKTYWKNPPEGRYMPFKEIAALSFGGMGVRLLIDIVSTMILSTGNVLIGNTIGIPPIPLYFIYVLSVLSGFPLTVLRARIIDYSNNKKGKYRPYILTMAIPTAILATGFVFMPYDKMTMFWKCFTVLAFNVGFQFFYNFIYDAYESITNVLSPNTYERTDVYSIKSITDSLSLTVKNLIFPIVAKLVTGEATIYNMKVYRAFYPPLLVLCVILSIIIYVGTEEKIVQSKTHTIRMSFADSIRAVAKNKYFWIISLASCLGFLENSFANILGWMYNYQQTCTAGQYSLIITVYGNSALWAMIFSPILIRKVGKKKLLVYSNLLNIVFIAIMYPVVKSAPTAYMIWMFLICLFVNGIVLQITVMITPGINGDIRDYQQYISGERVDGIFSVAGLIGSVWTLATGSVLPAIYDKVGLNENVAKSLGYSNVYDVLYNENFFRSICGVLIVVSVIGATMNVIPYFFYDLTENKQKAMIKVLKIRAVLEDFSKGQAEEKDIIEAVEIIKNAHNFSETEIIVNKKYKSQLLKLNFKKYRIEKREYKEFIKAKDEQEQNKFVLDELNYFENDYAKEELDIAKKIVSNGIENIKNLSVISVHNAKLLPKNSFGEKQRRTIMLDIARTERLSKKVIAKYFSDGISKHNIEEIEKLFSQEDEIDLKLKEAYQNDDKSTAKQLRIEKKNLSKKIKKTSKEYSIYLRAVKPFTDAEKVIKRYENNLKIDELLDRYSEIKM